MFSMTKKFRIFLTSCHVETSGNVSIEYALISVGIALTILAGLEFGRADTLVSYSNKWGKLVSALGNNNPAAIANF